MTSVRLSSPRQPRQAAAPRRLFVLACALMLAFCAAKFSFLTADFPNHSPWSLDQAKYTDEGWWAQAATLHHLLGRWTLPGDYNPAAAVPVWPLLLSGVFHFTGVSLLAARATEAALSCATLGIVFLLVRRYSTAAPTSTATAATLLLASSPFLYVFSRLAILDVFVLFQFCLLLLLASSVRKAGVLAPAALPILIFVMVLTKTTSLVLVPSVFWLAWCALGRRFAGFLQAAGLVFFIPALLVAAYVWAILHSPYAADFRYFFDVNGAPDIVWRQSLAFLLALLRHGFWIDRLLYPAALAALLFSLVARRELWRNPLFAASWIALAGQALFILSRQDDVAPRYFLPMLVPVVLIVTLGFGSLPRTLAPAWPLSLLTVCIACNAATIVGFLGHRQYGLVTAARSVRQIIANDPQHNRFLLGVTGSELSLLTGVPSLNDAFGAQDLALRVRTYRPGWCLMWNGIAPEIQAALSPLQPQPVATYTLFDDPDRQKLILYKLVDPAGATAPLPARSATLRPVSAIPFRPTR